MPDKSWMLNAKAIAAAKKCISVVETELGIKLKLSHPDFLELLVSYAELNDSEELHSALAVLAQFAPAKVSASLTGEEEARKVINLQGGHFFNRAKAEPVQAVAPAPVASSPEQAVVSYKGKTYPRYSDGKEFQGLYRGQPRYA